MISMHEYSEMYTLIHLLDAVSEIDVVGGKQQQRWGCGGGCHVVAEA